MPGILEGLNVAECAAFIACPYATMTLAQLGADVIRIDGMQGGLDYKRWPVAANGRSLYWAGLNKGKKSVRIDIRSEEGRELAQAIIAASGIFATNLPATGWLAPEALMAKRADLIMATIVGNHDGSTALDYTVNCAAGFPGITGPEGSDAPVNHVLPAWDLLAGMSLATAILAAERHRTRTGEGQRIRVALSDVAFAVVSDLGYLAEAQINGTARARHGNHIYGAFGHDFATADGRRLMVAAVSVGQWKSLVAATGIEPQVVAYEANGADLSLETDRFEAREAIVAWLAPWFAARTLDEARTALDAARACWGPYQDVAQMLAGDPRVSPANPMFAPVAHRGLGETLTARTPMDFSKVGAVPPLSGPVLGQHTDEVLATLLQLDSGAIGALHDRHIIGGPDDLK
ncbi:CoA transferase [Sphingomonas sp. AOB5]|uniref:CoA transferase n=1 Tax=Sphingomonas sp. AOB5 TaxID=3034017 RepID=UPI0023F722DF|nr:CoA transferase [Sphingomonas sp. AOB5]MDF7774770.1 CoA transferase [Sphingomonas sp. AOB5]